MKDITDYFRVPNTNAAAESPHAISKSPIPLLQCESKGYRQHDNEKRKIDTTSESDSDDAFKSPRKERKLISSPKSDGNEKPKYSDNVRVRLINIDADLELAKLKGAETPTKKRDRGLRVVLEDCSKFVDIEKLKVGKPIKFVEDEWSEAESPRKKKFKKRRPVIVDTDSSDDADSSGQLFKDILKSKKASLCCRKRPMPLNSMRSNDNNLLNYFKRNEKKPPFDDSPVKPPETFQVVALVHSPPKPRMKKLKLNDEIKENRSPIVKIVRADLSKLRKCDDTEVVRSEIMSIDEVEPFDKQNSKSDTYSSDQFQPVREKTLQPWKMRVQFVSTGARLKKAAKKLKSSKLVARLTGFDSQLINLEVEIRGYFGLDFYHD